MAPCECVLVAANPLRRPCASKRSRCGAVRKASAERSEAQLTHSSRCCSRPLPRRASGRAVPMFRLDSRRGSQAPGHVAHVIYCRVVLALLCHTHITRSITHRATSMQPPHLSTCASRSSSLLPDNMRRLSGICLCAACQGTARLNYLIASNLPLCFRATPSTSLLGGSRPEPRLQQLHRFLSTAA